MPAFFARPLARASALSAVLVLLAHGPVLTGGFQSDDFGLVELVRRDGPLGFWVRDEMFFRPLVPLTFWLDHRLYGLCAPGFHASNLAVHAAVAVCVGWVAMRLSPCVHASSIGQPVSTPRVDSTPIAPWLAGAALFAVLPSHAEAVDWIAARTDLWAALGGALSIVAFLRARACEHAGARRTLHAASLAAFALGLLAKESIVLLPGIVWLLEVVHLRTPPRRALARAAAHAAIAGVYVVVRAGMIGDWVGAYGAATHLDGTRFGWNLLYYPVRILLPPLRSGAFAVGATALALASLVAVVAMLHRGGRDAARGVCAAAGAFVLAAAPTLSLAVSPRSMEGERFLYWPSAVVCLALGVAAAPWLKHPRVRIACGALVALCAFASFAGASTQAAAGRLAERQARAAAALPDTGRILMGPLLDNLGGAYVFRNGFESAVRLHAPDGLRTWMPIAPVRWHPRRIGDAPRLRFIDAGRVLEAQAQGGWLSVVGHVGAQARIDFESPERVVFGLPGAGPEDLVVVFEGERARQCRPGIDCPEGELP